MLGRTPRFGYITGMRLGEVRSLRWEDVDCAAGVLRLRPEHAKTGEGRAIALEGDLADLIRAPEPGEAVYESVRVPFVAELVFHCIGQPIGDFRRAWARVGT